MSYEELKNLNVEIGTKYWSQLYKQTEPQLDDVGTAQVPGSPSPYKNQFNIEITVILNSQ